MHITTFDQLGIAKFCPKQEIINIITKSKETKDLWKKGCITQHGMNIASWKGVVDYFKIEIMIDTSHKFAVNSTDIKIQEGVLFITRDSEVIMFITRVSEVIMFSPCVFVTLFVSLSRCLSGRFNYEGLVPHKQYFAGTLLGMSSFASFVSRTHDVIDDVTRSQSRSNFESDISPSIFELERRSKTQNVGNAHGYLSGIFNFR